MTGELHAANAFYGHAVTLKRYSGFPQRRPLKVVIEHGLPWQPRFWDLDLENPFPLFLCASDERVALLDRMALENKVGVAVGPMISYIPPSAAEEGRPGSRLLLFPAHSSHHLDSRFDSEYFLDQALEPYGGWDVSVCLYWRDVLRGAERAYLERGLTCRTAGHMYDPRFLGRLRTIIESADAVVTNGVGTHVIYALALGRPVWHVNQPIEYAGEPAARLVGPSPPADYVGLQEEIPRLFAEPSPGPTEEQLSFGRRVGGLDRVRSPAELRGILDDGERRYRQALPVTRRTLRRGRRMARFSVDRGGQALRGR